MWRDAFATYCGEQCEPELLGPSHPLALSFMGIPCVSFLALEHRAPAGELARDVFFSQVRTYLIASLAALALRSAAPT